MSEEKGQKGETQKRAGCKGVTIGPSLFVVSTRMADGETKCATMGGVRGASDLTRFGRRGDC